MGKMPEKDWRIRKFFILAFWTDSSKTQYSVSLNKCLVGQKLSAKTWMPWLKKIMLTRLRKRSSIDTDHTGLYSWMIQHKMDQWFFEMTTNPQSLRKITCTGDQKITRSRSHRSIKTDKEEDANSQKHIVKVHEMIQKLSGNFGRVHRLLHPGGRVIIGMNGTITTHNTWWRIW